jgi:hypothetical protein
MRKRDLKAVFARQNRSIIRANREIRGLHFI